MSKRCQVTGSGPGFGNAVSHSHRRTRRRWEPNIQHRKFWVPSLRRWITLTVSVKGLHTIDRHGIDKVVADMMARGERF